MITADVGCRIFEADFSGIEAVLVGYYLARHEIDPVGAPQYIRMSRLGIHAGVAAKAAGEPVDWTASDDDVRKQIKHVKAKFASYYDPAKRVVHGGNYGLTPHGMAERFPKFFPTVKVAQTFQDFYYELAPGLPKWHLALRQQAHKYGWLGGPALPDAPPSIWTHPYGYRHAFWDVLSLRPMNEYDARKWLRDPRKAWRVQMLHGRYFATSMGGDANRVIAFYPQSTGAGRLKDAQLRLFLPDSPDYIGDAYFGRTPLLVPIHDSLVLQVPNRAWDRVVETVIRVMQDPSEKLPIPASWNWGPYLPIGISAKAGKNWAPRDERNPDGMDEIAVPLWMYQPPDPQVLPREGEGDVDDWKALERTVA